MAPAGTSRSTWSTATCPPANRFVSAVLVITRRRLLRRWLRVRGRRRGVLEHRERHRADEGPAVVEHQHVDQCGLQHPARAEGAAYRLERLEQHLRLLAA